MGFYKRDTTGRCREELLEALDETDDPVGLAERGRPVYQGHRQARDRGIFTDSPFLFLNHLHPRTSSPTDENKMACYQQSIDFSKTQKSAVIRADTLWTGLCKKQAQSSDNIDDSQDWLCGHQLVVSKGARKRRMQARRHIRGCRMIITELKRVRGMSLGERGEKLQRTLGLWPRAEQPLQHP